MQRSTFVARYLVPAGVFQSVIVGGGYGTGREVVEFVTRNGPWGGFIAIAAIALAFGAVLACSFELARAYRAYDYGSFFSLLLGRAGILYELLLMILLVLVLAVISAALAQLLQRHLGIDPRIGAVLGLAVILAFAYRGREFVQVTLTAGSVFLSAVVLAFFVFAVGSGAEAEAGAANLETGAGRSSLSGLQFALYNCAAVPALLFAVRGLDSRRTALLSGVFAGLAGALPALLFHLSFLGYLPAILEADLPAPFVLERIGAPWLLWIYLIALFVTIVQTGVGAIAGVVERWDRWSLERNSKALGPAARAGVVAGLLAASALLSQLGVISLIASGYGMLAWAFLAVFVIPLFTIGLHRILAASRRVPA